MQLISHLSNSKVCWTPSSLAEITLKSQAATTLFLAMQTASLQQLYQREALKVSIVYIAADLSKLTVFIQIEWFYQIMTVQDQE